MATLDVQHRVVAAADALASDLGDEVVLLDSHAGKYIILAETAADIWRAVQTPIEVGGLCHRLARDYAAPVDRVTMTTLAFLEDLLARQLITRAP